MTHLPTEVPYTAFMTDGLTLFRPAEERPANELFLSPEEPAAHRVSALRAC